MAVGGEDEKVVLRSVECYCVKSHTWRSMACLPFAVRYVSFDHMSLICVYLD